MSSKTEMTRESMQRTHHWFAITIFTRW